MFKEKEREQNREYEERKREWEKYEKEKDRKEKEKDRKSDFWKRVFGFVKDNNGVSLLFFGDNDVYLIAYNCLFGFALFNNLAVWFI